MTKAKTSHRRRSSKKNEESSARRNENRQPKKSEDRPSRSLLKDSLFALVVCIAFFAVLEVGLRLAGVPHVDLKEDPFVGFSTLQPLFQVNNGIASTAPAKLKFFNAASFSSKKPDNTFRVFCFGGSTTYGHPFDGRTSFSRWLEDLLKASCPNKNIEMINAGGISYASYRIVPIVRETLAFQPDLMVMLLGHNEFLERRTYAGMFDQGRTLIETKSFLQKFNTYRALEKLLAPVLPKSGSVEARKSGDEKAETQRNETENRHDKTVLNAEVTAILDRSAGLELYHRDEEFSKNVVRHFRYNFQTMLSLCKESGIPVIVAEAPSNLKDFSPFKSEHGENLSASDKARLEKQLHSAEHMIEEKQFPRALEILDKEIAEDPLYADYYFYKGRALLGLGRFDEARKNFVKAKDLDVCPLRCISPIAEEIREITREEKVVLVPFQKAVDDNAAKTGDKSGIPGNESFLDHVHPTVRLHQVLAEMLFEKITDLRLLPVCRSLTTEEQEKILAKGMASVDKQFFLLRDLNLAKTLRWAGRKREAREALDRVATQLTDNAEVHKMLGSFLLEDGKYPEAVKEYRRAVELSGNDAQMLFALAVAYYRSGLKDQALGEYRRLVDQDKSIPEAFANLAVIRLEQGQVAEAMNVLKSGLKQHPDAPSLFSPCALALALSGNIKEAVDWQRRAVEAEPGNAKHLYNLAGMYALLGNSAEALHSLDLAVQRGYSDAGKLDSDPVFSSIRGRPEYQKLLDRIR